VKTAILLLMLAQSSTETWVNAPRTLRVSTLDQFVDVTNAAVYKSGAVQLIRETIGIEPRDLTFLIHVVRWSDGGEIVKQNWYVFRSGKWTDAQFGSANRIYGRGSVWFLYLQLNARSAANTTYVIETTKKAPAYFAHLQSAAGLFGVSLTDTVGEAQNIWNAKLLTIPYVPSDVVITPKFGGATAATFDDEGLSWFDFSAAVPVTKTSSAGMFGVADLYFRPTDITGLGFGNWPHAVEGVWVGSQPLKHILMGVGWGPMYAGVVMGGGTYTFSFGVNISASAAASALKK
jgi:hypothetical protein